MRMGGTSTEQAAFPAVHAAFRSETDARLGDTDARLPDDLRLVATAWESLSDDAKRSILFIVRSDARAERG